jgi:4-hydroxybenzoate polyprenyltransferase
MGIKWQEYGYGRIDWFMAIRPLNCIFLSLAIILSFKLSGLPPANGIRYAVAVFVIYAATVVWNDYSDRDIDRKKDKMLAYNNSKQFLIYSLVLWIIAITIAIILAMSSNPYVSVLLFFLIAAGLLYTIAERKSSILKNGIVAAWAGAICLFPFVLTKNINTTVIWSMILLISMNYAREIIKDMEDENIDGNTKVTLVKSRGDEHHK